MNCTFLCLSNEATDRYECILCLNSLFYDAYKKHDDLFIIKNGLRFINDAQKPRYLLQTINYQWNISSDINNFKEWQSLFEHLQTNFIAKFYSKTFEHVSFWWSSELMSTYTLMKQLKYEKHVLIVIKFILIMICSVLFTGVLGIFVALTTLLSFMTCMGILTLLSYQLTVENASYFIVVLIVCTQHSALYSVRYVVTIKQDDDIHDQSSRYMSIGQIFRIIARN